MEKTTRVLALLLVMAAVGLCSNIRVLKKESKKVHSNSISNLHHDDHDSNSLPRVSSPLASTDKPKLLPIRIETEGKKWRTEDILRHLGMSKLRTKNQGNNHRKRLASQSRKSHNEKHLEDSHVYVIKLPANKYYYDHSFVRPVPAHEHGEHGHKQHHHQQQQQQPQHINRIPLSFKSNGKPGKIYHYNLPVVKKMVARKTGNPKLVKEHDANQVIKPGPIWPKEEPSMHYRRVSYFKPKKPSKQAFHKYFPGNGRPHSLYIIETNRQSSAAQPVKL